MFPVDPSQNARGRLLPPSVPFRFFTTAMTFQIAAWAVLAVYAEDAAGGISWGVLAALHLITLGVLAMTAIGATYQLLPVATKRPVRSPLLCTATYWLLTPGVLLLIGGLLGGQGMVAALGGSLAGAALSLYLILLVDNLLNVKEMPVVIVHIWGAAAALLATIGLGIALALNLGLGYLPDRAGLLQAHALLATYGFMGMMSMGLSHVLIPMFALAPAAETRPNLIGAVLAMAALLLAGLGSVLRLDALVALAALLGLAVAAIYGRAMVSIVKQRMRKQLGFFFTHLRLAWILLPASLMAGLLALAGLLGERGPLIFGFLLVFGWLLTFLTGTLSRIMPFLASMHTVSQSGRTPLLSALMAEWPLRIQLGLHLGALLLVLGGLAGGWADMIRLGALLGIGGAVALAAYGIELWRRCLAHIRSA
ncbi:MAG: hypothetical protein IT565_02540 [Rhodospirillales bacterium]|nr:hypothetical protein [Rhodospirillales bacterium]